MGFKKCTIVLIILSITISLLSSSSAGGQRRFLRSNIVLPGESKEELVANKFVDKEDNVEEVVRVMHGRILKVNTNDYGSYDPSPTMNKPRFKDIPN